jgi:succinate-semialdehyde dehydrogenase/glutarate-semialdehyde dehydrogenase
MKQTPYTSPSLFVAGEWIAESARVSPVVNPSTGEQIGATPLADEQMVDRALAAAQAGFEVWRRTPASERGRIMKSAAARLRERMDEAVAHLVMEQGKPIAEARSEMENCALLLEWCPDEAARVADRVLPPRAAFRDLRVRHEPIGPVAAIAPWNFPASLAGRKVASALAVGCSVIVRPAGETPAAIGYLARALDEAGLPKGVLNIVYGDPEMVTSRLIDSPVIKKVAFTGSTQVGSSLAARTSANAKPSVMELGGHAPVLVCEDADVARAVELSVISKFRNAGQVCVSPTRYYVHDRIFDAFAAGFAEGARSLVVGDGMDPATQMGPMANERRVFAVERLVEDARDRGATVLTGGERLNRPGYFYMPTVLANVPDDAAIMTEEPFGPIAVVNRFDDLDVAIRSANSTPYALGAYAFSRSEETSEKLARELDAGMVGINSYSIVFTDSPIGGRRSSGFGSEGGPEGIAAYLIPKFTSIS